MILLSKCLILAADSHEAAENFNIGKFECVRLAAFMGISCGLGRAVDCISAAPSYTVSRPRDGSVMSEPAPRRIVGAGGGDELEAVDRVGDAISR